MLEFDPTAHVYRLDGRVLPSVTQVLDCLNTLDGIPPETLEHARLRGQYVHEACDLHDRGVLDWATLDPTLVPYLEGYANWLSDSGAVVAHSELRVCHPKMWYAGTLDMLAIVNGRLAVIDRKATAELPPTVGPQTAAYAEAAGQDGHKVVKRYCLHLNPAFSRGYKFTALPDPSDWSIFLSCLNIHRWRNKHAA